MKPEDIGALTPAQRRALLAELVGARSFPLALGQQRLWFLQRLVPGNPVFNVPVALRLRGALDVAALGRGLAEICRRHEILRMRFEESDDGPVQRVEGAQPFDLPILDLTPLPAASREGEAKARASREAERPFDLQSEPPLRTFLLRLAPDDHLLLIVAHHIVVDARSLVILFEELGSLYADAVTGRTPRLPPAPLQYGEWVSWQRRWLGGEDLDASVSHWLERLDGAPRVLQLPTDRPRPAMQDYRGAWRAIRLPATLREQLVAVGRAEGATLFMVLLAGYQMLLSRYSGAKDLLVGTPTTGRNGPETEGLIGYFVNTLVLRGDLSGDPTLRELLRRTRRTCLDAYAHQDAPFERLVERINPDRSFSHSPLFQVMFDLQYGPPPRLELAGLETSDPWGPGELHNGRSKVDLSLIVEEHGAELLAGFEYSTTLFDAETIERMLAHFRMLLEAGAAEADIPVSRLGMLSATERAQVVVEWNQTRRPYPDDATIHELFEEQARQTPDAVAIESEAGRLSYADLNRRADRLAQQLRAIGLTAEGRVGLYVERSPEAIVAMLATLKADGSYLPLDPEWPAERLAFMLEDAGASVVLTQEHLKPRLGDCGRPVIEIGSEPLDARSVDLPSTGASAHTLAYVTYTSGSTGRPKGVAVSHRAVVRLVRGVDYCDLDANQTLLQLTPLSFDPAMFEVWGALLNGARLAIAPPGPTTSESVVAAIERHGVTTLWLTASLFHAVVVEQAGRLSGVRQLLAGGDVLTPDLVRLALRRQPGLRVINGYGPTECATFASSHPMSVADQVSEPVSIGRPISNTRTYVLDPRGEPNPVGVPGELYIGGDAVARGYVGRGALTAERFVPDPFSDRAGDRLYRTGDRVRWLADGTLQFLGRFDHQVKLRGFRVEPGEIEAALGKHPAVREAAVLRQGDQTRAHLTAYVTALDGERVENDDLRRFLRRTLPEYMIPAAFVHLSSMPLTPTGKIDRGALAAVDGGRIEPAADLEPPEGVLEHQVAKIWSEVLPSRPISVHDSFFDLGGHSLLLLDVQGRLRKALDPDITVVDLFRYPTISSLAAHLEERRAGRAPASERCSE